MTVIRHEFGVDATAALPPGAAESSSPATTSAPVTAPSRR
jgi:hypothetical protein